MTATGGFAPPDPRGIFEQMKDGRGEWQAL
jgi:hypothetical protein